jgi:hypothetical protein
MRRGHMSLWDWWKSLLLQGARTGPSTQRLDGRSKTLLAASIKALPYETPGWITNKDAKQLFSPMDDQYAFGEMDEVGKSNIADFAAHVTLRDRGWSTTWELRMAKSRAEIMELVEKLFAECAEFQRRRPDLPQRRECEAIDNGRAAAGP